MCKKCPKCGVYKIFRKGTLHNSSYWYDKSGKLNSMAHRGAAVMSKNGKGKYQINELARFSHYCNSHETRGESTHSPLARVPYNCVCFLPSRLHPAR